MTARFIDVESFVAAYDEIARTLATAAPSLSMHPDTLAAAGGREALEAAGFAVDMSEAERGRAVVTRAPQQPHEP